MIKAIVIDDVKVIRESVIEFLKPYSAELTVVSEADSVQSALEEISKHKPGALFLDVELKDGTSFDLLKQIHVSQYKVIFITAYGHYAIQAFKFSAIDYLLKPINPDELDTAVRKLRDVIAKEAIESKFNALFQNLRSLNHVPEKLVLKTFDNIYSVNIKDIIRCESDNNYTKFHLADGKKILVSVTLKEYEELLGEHRFFRIHQSHLVNLDHFDHFNKQDGGYVVMKDQASLPLASRKKNDFLRIIEAAHL